MLSMKSKQNCLHYFCLMRGELWVNPLDGEGQKDKCMYSHYSCFLWEQLHLSTKCLQWILLLFINTWEYCSVISLTPIACFKCYPGIHLYEERKTIWNFSRNSRQPDCHLNCILLNRSLELCSTPTCFIISLCSQAVVLFNCTKQMLKLFLL